MFKVAPRPAWPGQWGGGGMLRETGRVRRRLLTNLMCPTSLPSSSPHPSPLSLSQPGPAPNSDFTTQFSAAFPSKELVVNVRMSGKTGT